MNSPVRSVLRPSRCCCAHCGCGKKEAAAEQGAAPAPPAEEKVLNLYNWNDYLAEDTIANFEKETGIKVTYDIYGSNEELETQARSPGNSGYDVVVPSASFLRAPDQGRLLPEARQDQAAEPQEHGPGHLKRGSPCTTRATTTPCSTCGAPPASATTSTKIKDACRNAPLDSWNAGVRSEVVAKFKKCGVAVLDCADRDVSMALACSRQGSQQPEAGGPEGGAKRC